VKPRTQKLWAKQDQHEGDRLRLFSAVATAVDGPRVLYPGSFVDIAASFAFPSVTYVDNIRSAADFFSDHDGVHEIVATHQIDDAAREVTFLGEDYRDDLDSQSTARGI